MKTIPIHCAIILTVFGALAGVGCASHHSQRTETSSDNGEPVEDVGGLTPQQVQWVEGKTQRDFHDLMLSLDEAGPITDNALSFLEGELEAWPDRARLLPSKWTDQALVGEALPQHSVLAETVSLRNRGIDSEDLERNLSHPQFLEMLAHVSFLDLGQNTLGAEGAEILAQISELEGLRGLNLDDNSIGPEGMAHLASSSSLSELSYLNLSSNGLGPEGVRTLVSASEFVAGIEYLVLDDNSINAQSMGGIGDSENLQSVVALSLSNNRIGAVSSQKISALSLAEVGSGLEFLKLSDADLRDKHVHQIFDSASLQELRYLDMSGNDLRPEAVSIIAEEDFQGLEHIALGRNTAIGPKGAEILADWQGGASLRGVNLSCSGMTSEGAAVVLNSEYLRNLEELYLAGNGVGWNNDGVLEQFAQIPELRRLDLTYNFIDDEGVQRLVGEGRLSGLEYLNLGKNLMGNGGAHAIAMAGHLDNLEVLRLHDNYLDTEAVSLLSSVSHLDGLEQLDLSSNDLTPEAASVLSDGSHFGCLERLCLGRTELDENDAEDLREPSGFAREVEIEVEGEPLSHRRPREPFFPDGTPKRGTVCMDEFDMSACSTDRRVVTWNHQMERFFVESM